MSLLSQIESLLLITAEPLEFKEIAKILAVDKKTIADIVSRLKQECQNQKRGFRIVSNDIKAELATAPENAEIVKRLINFEKAAISQAKIETLTILAYQGPLTKVELEDIRGVNCSLILKNLKINDLIDEASVDGRLEYQVSTKFLKTLGITSVEELPDYDKLKIKKC